MLVLNAKDTAVQNQAAQDQTQRTLVVDWTQARYGLDLSKASKDDLYWLMKPGCTSMFRNARSTNVSIDGKIISADCVGTNPMAIYLTDKSGTELTVRR